MSTILKQSTEIKVRVGPFMDAADAVTPETGITLGAADQAELMKANGAATVDIAAATWAAVTGAGGWYDLTLTTSHTDTVGELVVAIQDTTVCLPVFKTFQVVEEAVFDALFGADAAGYQVPIWAAASSTVNLSATTIATLNGHTAQTGDTFALASGAGVAVAAASKSGYSLTPTTGLGNQTANITGNLTGSVGDVLAISGSTAAANNIEAVFLGTGAAADVDLSARSLTLNNDTGPGLTTLGTYASWYVEATSVDSPAVILVPNGTGAAIDPAINANVTTLGAGAITATSIASNAITDTKIASGAFTAAKFAAGAFDAVWTVATRTLSSFGSLVTDIWAAATRTLSAGTNIALAKGTGVTGFTDLDAAGVRAAVGLAAADLGDRLPATLAGGLMRSDTLAINGSAPAAARQALAALAIYSGAVDSATTTTITDAGLVSGETDNYVGRVVLFGAGALLHQGARIIGFNFSTDTLTVTALSSAPTAADPYIIV